MKKLVLSAIALSIALSVNVYAAKILGSTDRGDNREIAIECNNGKVITVFNYYSNNTYWINGKQFSDVNSAANYGCR